MKTSTFFILIGFLLLAPSSSTAEILRDKDCGSCHRLSVAETEKNFAAPDLHFAGDKFQPAWLKQFLKNPAVIRPAVTVIDTPPRPPVTVADANTAVVTAAGFLRERSGNSPPHPSFSEQDASALADGLMGLKISAPPRESTVAAPLSKRQRAKIKYKFERTFSCISCHQSLNLAGKVRGGISGPSLVNAGNRLRADWIVSWLKTPEAYAAKSRMPRYEMDSVTRNQFSQFLMTLKKENVK